MNYTLINEDKVILFDEVLELGITDEKSKELTKIVKDREVIAMKIELIDPIPTDSLTFDKITLDKIKNLVIKLKNIQ